MRDVVQRSGATLLQLSLASLNFVSDVDLFVVAEHCKRLTELELSACTGFTSAALARLVSSLPALKELALDECNAVTDPVLIAIAEHLPQLEFLNLSKSRGYTKKGPLALSESLRCSRRLAIEPNHAILTRAIVTMWEEIPPDYGSGNVTVPLQTVSNYTAGSANSTLGNFAWTRNRGVSSTNFPVCV
jgi:hypothetical protein